MSQTITVTRVIPARAERIYNAWLDPAEHAKMTGASATAGEGQVFTAWDGYISGRTLSSEPASRIVQSWRTTEFPEGADDSTLTITLDEVDGGTKVTLHHEHVPEGQGEAYQKGWDDYYFTPMGQYFTTAGSRLKEVTEALSGAVEKTEAAVEHAIEDVEASVTKASGRARKQAAKAVKAVKKVQKRAARAAKAVGKSVQKLLAKKPKKAAKKAPKNAKKVAKKAAPKVAKKGLGAPAKRPATQQKRVAARR
jgi:uncharacterized protein YndB with AHSA1/START domain